jgi:glucose-1-phosphate adenylyltransferase
LRDVLIAEGCRVLKSDITHSIIGIRSQIATGCVIKDSIVIGSDYYDRENKDSDIPLGIGANCHIEGAILDKNVHIGSDVTIRPFPRNTDIDNDKWYVRDGIVVIPKDTVLESGTNIGP